MFTRERVNFFAFGLLVSVAALWLSLHWPNIGEDMFGGFNYNSQPIWFKVAGKIVIYSPLIVGFIALALRIFYSQRVKPVSYVVGAAIPYIVLSVVLLVINILWPSPFD